MSALFCILCICVPVALDKLQKLKMQILMAKAVKCHGRVYTPDYLVKNILNFGGYYSPVILKKHVIDNSCGDGAFLSEIVERYCLEFFQNNSNPEMLKKDLEEYVHGIELDETEWKKCLNNLDCTVAKYDIEGVDWNVKNADTLEIDIFNGKMDFVFGNPPYVRVHNLEDSYDLVKKYRFSSGGMTDLFIVFFEIGFNMLSKNGRMCLITPSSWLSSKAGQILRSYIIQHQNLSGVVDLEHFQPFEATTYTLISRFETNPVDFTQYYRYDELELLPEFQENISLNSFCINDSFYLSSNQNLKLLKKIKTGTAYHYVSVKNGFATLADNVFIGDFGFVDGTIDVLKASTGKWLKCVFPYDEKGRPLSLEDFRKNKNAFSHLQKNVDKLSKRDIENNKSWYLFGRTQALKDVFTDKIAINTIVKDVSSIKLERVEVGKGVYSGLYILTDEPFEIIRDLIVSQEFVNYIALLKNYKSGGYYTFTSKDLEQYLNYKLSEKYGQSRIFNGNLELF